MVKNKKQYAAPKKLAFVGLMFNFLILQAVQNSDLTQAAAQRTIATLIQEIAKAQQSIDALYQSDLKTKTILQDIATLNAQMTTLKDQSGITSIETQLGGVQDQLNQGAVNIWSSSIDPTTNVNLNRTINNALNAIFSDDTIKKKLESVSTLKREIGDRIAQKGWMNSIQKLGTEIEAIAPNEIKQVAQALSAYQSAQSQIVSTRNSNPSFETTLLPLEIALAAQQLNLKNKIIHNQLIDQQLLRYNNDLKKLNFTLDLLQNPSKATNITQESISNFDTSFNDIIM